MFIDIYMVFYIFNYKLSFKSRQYKFKNVNIFIRLYIILCQTSSIYKIAGLDPIPNLQISCRKSRAVIAGQRERARPQMPVKIRQEEQEEQEE